MAKQIFQTEEKKTKRVSLKKQATQHPLLAMKTIDDIIYISGVTMQYPVPKRYRELLFRPFAHRVQTALRDISLTVPRGECLGILGPNGAGKTTLLRIIGGLLYPSHGSVLVDGYDAHSHNQSVRERVGYVMNEERSFYWRLTGLQNLQFFGALNDLYGKQLVLRANELLDLVGLGHAGEIRVSNYSCGMRQRLAIARGLLSDPEILILDEPTKSLDPLGAEELRQFITKEILGGQDKTVVIATHQIEEAEMLCDRVCILSEGTIIANHAMTEVHNRLDGLANHYKSTVSGCCK